MLKFMGNAFASTSYYDDLVPPAVAIAIIVLGMFWLSQRPGHTEIPNLNVYLHTLV